MSDNDKVICPNCVHEFVSVNVQAKVAQLEEDYGRACKLLADMHDAASGRPGDGQRRGVIEDVSDLRAVGTRVDRGGRPLCDRLRDAACDEANLREKAADKLETLDSFLRSMQADAVRYLVPDNECGADWFVSRMLWHLDGPAQREAQDGVTNVSALLQEIRGYLVAAADGSMSRNNSEQLACELLKLIDA